MSNSTYIYLANKAPKPPSTGAVTQAADGTFANGTYTFIVVAWDRLRETDLSYAGYWKHSNYLPDNANPTGGEQTSDWAAVTVTGATDDKITLKWHKVNGPVNHYTIYCQTDDGGAFDLINSCVKVRHTEVDNGDGTISGTITDSQAGYGANVTEYVISTAADPINTVTLAGDVRSNFHDGAQATMDSSGAVTVESVALSNSGLNTVITIAGGTPLNGNDTYITYASGGKQFSLQPAYINASSLFAISPIEDIIETPRVQMLTAFNGVHVKKSYAIEKLRDSCILLMPSGIFEWDEINHLLRCCRAGHRMLLYNANNTYTAYERGWYGHIELPDYLHTEGKRARGEFELTFVVEQGWSSEDDYLENVIT